MFIKAAAIIENLDENTIELWGDALASSNPQLSITSFNRIAAIQEIRLAELHGGDYLQASNFFELLASLPPIEGPKAVNFLQRIANTDFTYESIERALSIKSEEPENIIEENLNRGFATLNAQVSGSKKQIEVVYNVDKSSREGVNVVAHMIKSLSEISDAEHRKNLIDDCRKIVDLRFEFDLTI